MIIHDDLEYNPKDIEFNRQIKADEESFVGSDFLKIHTATLLKNLFGK